MDDRWANIDLVFRNGLKDFEALPPEDVWNNVSPVIGKKRSFLFLKAAATFAAVVSIGLAAYMLGRKTAFSDESLVAGFSPATIFTINQPAAVTSSSVISDLKETTASPAPVSSQSVLTNTNGSSLIAANEVRNESTDNSAVFNKNNLDLNQKQVSAFPDNLDEVITGISQKNSLEIQDFETGRVKPSERWSVSALASPTYYSKTRAGNSLVKDMIASERSVSSVSGGVSVSYNLSRRISIQTGIYYASHGQQVEGVNSYAGFQKYSPAKGASDFTVLTSDGPVFSHNADVFMAGPDNRVQTMYTSDVFDPDKANLVPIDNSIIQKFGYIQMPIMVRYKFFDRNLDLNLAGGISYDLLIGNSAYIRHGGQKYDLGETAGLNSSVFSSSIGMGMEYSISRKMSFNIEPTFRYFLNSFNDATGTLIHPYSFGVFSGFSYKF